MEQQMKIEIVMQPGGRVTVSTSDGLLANKVLMYGLLHIALDSVKDYHDQSRQQTKIEPVSMVLPEFPRGVNRG